MRITAKPVGLALFLGLSLMISSQSTFAADSGAIIESLTPKKTVKTRSAFGSSGGMSDKDKAFLSSLPATRGLAFEERQRLDEIVVTQDLPRIDITINFDYNSDRIRPDSIPGVNELGLALTSSALSSYRIVLNGHTDASGSDTYNQDLSERRARSVRNYLIRTFGISSDRLIAVGYGEERLKDIYDPNAAINRRVEVVNLADY